jgi:hypothetical protein
MAEANIRFAKRTKFKDDFSSEGIRKLYSEMLQLDNQRFLLTTTAVVFFGTVAGWVTTTLLRAGGRPAESEPGAAVGLVPYLLPVSTALVWAVLYVLFHYQLLLAHTVRWLAVYQMLQGSDWEWTWHFFRRLNVARESNDVPFAAYRVITTIFKLLIVVAFFYFLILQAFLFPPNIGATWEEVRRAVFGSLTSWHFWALLTVVLPLLLLLIQLKTNKLKNADETAYLERWREAQERSQAGPAPDDPSPGP